MVKFLRKVAVCRFFGMSDENAFLSAMMKCAYKNSILKITIIIDIATKST